MDDVARSKTRGEESDLAAIVLGRTPTVDRRIDAPERVPAWLDDTPARGYDARSVAVLALVVAVMAAVVGWATSINDRPSAPANPAAAAQEKSPEDAFGDAFGSVAATAKASTKQAATPTVAHGVDLSAGRIVASTSGSGSGLVTVAVRNAGDTAMGSTEATVLLLLQGDVVGTQTISSLAAGASTRVEFPIGWCPAGRSAVSAVIDAGASVREADERNNSLSQSASFGC